MSRKDRKRDPVAPILPLPGGPRPLLPNGHGPLVVGIAADAAPAVRAEWLTPSDA